MAKALRNEADGIEEETDIRGRQLELKNINTPELATKPEVHLKIGSK